MRFGESRLIDLEVIRLDLLRFNTPPFPVYIKGDECCMVAGNKHFKRVFSVFDMVYVRQGEFFITENKIRYALKEGEYIILAPGLEHYGHQQSMENTDFTWIHFDIEEGGYDLVKDESVRWAKIFLQDSTFTEPARYQFHLPRYGRIQHKEVFEGHLQKLMQMNQGQAPEQKMKQQIEFLELILVLQKEAIMIPSSAEQVTELILAYTHQHYAEPIKMSDLAHATLFHPDYLTRCMQQVIGMSPTQYISQYRLAMGKHLLTTTNETIRSIAENVGFADYTYFSKLFKKTEGMSPLEYRRIAMRR